MMNCFMGPQDTARARQRQLQLALSPDYVIHPEQDPPRLQEIGIFPVPATEVTLWRSDSALASLAALRDPVTRQSTIAR